MFLGITNYLTQVIYFLLLPQKEVIFVGKRCIPNRLREYLSSKVFLLILFARKNILRVTIKVGR